MTCSPIAIIGIGCRFPGGARGPDAFWRILRDGVDAITDMPADRWNTEAYYDSTPGRKGKTTARWGGFLDAIDQFDAGFFGVSPREAAFMDPQQRLLLHPEVRSVHYTGATDLRQSQRLEVMKGLQRNRPVGTARQLTRTRGPTLQRQTPSPLTLHWE